MVGAKELKFQLFYLKRKFLHTGVMLNTSPRRLHARLIIDDNIAYNAYTWRNTTIRLQYLQTILQAKILNKLKFSLCIKEKALHRSRVISSTSALDEIWSLFVYCVIIDKYIISAEPHANIKVKWKNKQTNKTNKHKTITVKQKLAK